MRVDVDLDNCVDHAWENQFSQTRAEPKSNLHELIFVAYNSDLTFANRSILQSSNNTRSASVFSSSARHNQTNQTMVAGSRVNGSVQGRVDVTWGGSEGVKTEVEVKGEAHNDKGDNLGVTYHRDNDGNSHTTVEGRSSSDDASSNKDKDK